MKKILIIIAIALLSIIIIFKLKAKNSKYVLTYTLISELTGLHLETVRRHVKRLENLNWVRYSKLNGVEYHASKENNRILTEEFNPRETSLVLNFINYVDKIN